MTDREGEFLWAELREFVPAFGSLVFFSAIITLLYLVPSIYMQQIYERVMQSRNASTLGVLAAIVVMLCAAWTLLEQIRVRVLQQVGNALDEKISARVFDALNRHTDNLPFVTRGMILQDLSIVRDFLGGSLLISFLDVIWVPLIILAAALLHPILGVTILTITMVVSLLAFLTQRVAREDIVRSLSSASQANEFGRAVMRSAEATRVMGMTPALVSRWRSRQELALGWQQGAINRTLIFSTLLNWLRHLYLPITLTVGVMLFLAEMVGGGVIFAASIIVSRAVQPVDAIANSWRAFWNVSLSAKRIDRMLRESSKRTYRVALPTPVGPLVVSRVAASPRNQDMVVLTDVSFYVQPGRVVGVVGPSGAGKSSLARVLTGAWPLLRGSIMLDGSELAHWDQDQLGRFIGYVPQDVELLPGTLAENIARFDDLGTETDAKVIQAVKLANVQDIVGRLPEGLNTRLGPDGYTLSGGQRQRIALARAVYGDPKLVVLDEPNSNLDAVGEQSLGNTIGILRERGAIVVLVTHRLSMLSCCDLVLVMNAGTVHAFGERDQVVKRLGTYKPTQYLPEHGQPANDGPAAA